MKPHWWRHTDALLFVALVVLLAGSALIAIYELQARLLDARVVKVIDGVVTIERARPSLRRSILNGLASVGSSYRRFYRAENLEQLRSVVQSAGFNPHTMMPIPIGSKTVSMILTLTLMAAYFVTLDMDWNSRIVVMLFAVAAGILVPRLTLRHLANRFNADIQSGMPDAIDLLVVCGEAGMGLESGLERVAQEMQRSNPSMNRVLTGLLDDLRVLPDRRDAFENLSQRSTSDGLRRFGTMINQSLQYGTPLNHALRTVADELRRDRITKLEERAHKLGAKLTIPMVLFMLPAMFIILAGSPFLHLMQTMKSIGVH